MSTRIAATAQTGPRIARRPSRLHVVAATVFTIILLATTCTAQPPDSSLHTNPLNLDPVVREGFQHFYILDYEGAISRFESVLKAHPQDPMASGYVLMVTRLPRALPSGPPRHHLLRARLLPHLQTQRPRPPGHPRPHRVPHQHRHLHLPTSASRPTPTIRTPTSPVATPRHARRLHHPRRPQLRLRRPPGPRLPQRQRSRSSRSIPTTPTPRWPSASSSSPSPASRASSA